MELEDPSANTWQLEATRLRNMAELDDVVLALLLIAVVTSLWVKKTYFTKDGSGSLDFFVDIPQAHDAKAKTKVKTQETRSIARFMSETVSEILSNGIKEWSS